MAPVALPFIHQVNTTDSFRQSSMKTHNRVLCRRTDKESWLNKSLMESGEKQPCLFVEGTVSYCHSTKQTLEHCLVRQRTSWKHNIITLVNNWLSERREQIYSYLKTNENKCSFVSACVTTIGATRFDRFKRNFVYKFRLNSLLFKMVSILNISRTLNLEQFISFNFKPIPPKESW